MILSFGGKSPRDEGAAFVADNATLRGSVTLGANSSIFFGAVLRADREDITIGAGSNIQDNCVVHVEYDLPVTVGKNVTVGHGAILHGCTVEDKCLIGMNSVILDHAVIGEGSIVGAGAVVAAGTIVPPRSLVVGIPAKVKKTLTDEDVAGSVANADSYLGLMTIGQADPENQG